MKIGSLLLLLLFTAYSSAALATWSGTSGWGETDWGNNEWNKPDWGDKQWSDMEGDKPDWGDKQWSGMGGDKPDWGNNEWGDKDWDKDHASCDPKYDVPEPGIVGLLAIGLLGMVVTRRRLNHK